MDGWKDVTPERPENPDVEGVRELAWRVANDFGFHEVAIASPFEAEGKYMKLGREILSLLGYPKNVTLWALDEDASRP